MLCNIIFYIIRGLIQHINIQNYYPTGKKTEISMRVYREECKLLCSLPYCINQHCLHCQRGTSWSTRDNKGGCCRPSRRHDNVPAAHSRSQQQTWVGLQLSIRQPDLTSPSTKPLSIKQINPISTVYKIVSVRAVLSSHDSKVCCRDPQ